MKTTFKKFVGKGALHVFDIDDTLFHTNAEVHVLKDGKTIKTLTNREFNDYKLKDGESFDYKEFKDAEKFNKESKPIRRMIDNLKRINAKIKLNLTPGSKIIMNTARGTFDDMDKFLKTFADHDIDIDHSHVKLAGSIPGSALPAEKKLVFIRQYLRKHDYEDVFMYDDSKTNLTYFLKLRQEYPHIKFHAFLVTKEGKLQSFP